MKNSIIHAAIFSTVACLSQVSGLPAFVQNDSRDDSQQRKFNLELQPLAPTETEEILRIHDGQYHIIVITTSDDDVRFRLIQMPDASPDIDLEPTVFVADYSNRPQFAKSLKYIVSRIAEFESNRSGLNGSTLYIDSIDGASRSTAFSIWSPSPEDNPLAYEMYDFFWRFIFCVNYLQNGDSSTEPDLANLSLMFPGTSTLQFSRKIGKECITLAIESRIISTAKALNTIEQGAAANP